MPARKWTFFQRCLSFTSVRFETIQLSWNTTSSKFRVFCLSCLPILSAQKWLVVLWAKLITGSRSHLSSSSPLLKMPCCKLFVYRCVITEINIIIISVYPYIVLMAGIMLLKFGGLCTNFSFGRNDISHRWVACFSTKKKNCTSVLRLLFEYSTGQKLPSALQLFLRPRTKVYTLYHSSENRKHSSLGHPFHV